MSGTVMQYFQLVHPMSSLSHDIEQRNRGGHLRFTLSCLIAHTTKDNYSLDPIK